MPASTDSNRPDAIVGIGASAGGIEAMQRFLSVTPPDTGLGFVLVMHLQASHKSHLSEVLQSASKISVVTAVDGEAVRRDTLHVIPPDATLTIENGVLQLHAIDSEQAYRQIDTFFRSLAADQEDRAVCAVLAGAGSDGALGLRAIKEHGGMTLTARTDESDPASQGAQPARDSMPRAAAATGLADHIVSVEEMPELAVAYVQHLNWLAEAGGDQLARLQENLPAICQHIRARTDHDLRQYKPATLLRRIQRRMQALQIADPNDYVAQLASSPEEIDALHRDILIGVTSFFRDPDAFTALEQRVVPDLVNRAEESRSAVRVWVPGCGTGEEAYSLAILLHEACGRRNRPPDVQIFGSDVDTSAIRQARSGHYSKAVAEQLAPERRARYLEEDGDSYRVVRQIRELCLFSEHDLIRHPPFSRIDLISCRNLLIYLDNNLQGRLIPLFHYALRSGGYLFLGSSETLGQHSNLFESVDKRNRIFRRHDGARTKVPEFPIAKSGQLPPHARVRQAPEDDARTRLTRKAERNVLDAFAPAYVILDANREAVYLAPGVDRYLQLPVGAPRNNVLDMAPSRLRPALRKALRAAADGAGNLVEQRVDWSGGDGSGLLDLCVKQIRERRGDAEMYLLVFREPATGGNSATRERPVEPDRAEGEGELERELAETKFDLQATIEELEASNEELQSANEELLSMNEELQSSNEELESSQEELQSLNEEMETVNAELQDKVQDLDRSNADLRNLIDSTRIPTIFLDRELHIKWFTPDTRKLFNLISTDTGRPFSDLSSRLEAPPERELTRTLETEETVERQVQLSDGSATYIMRILPYRTRDGEVDGLVLTFVDITKLHQVSADLGSLLDLVPVGIALSRDTNGTRVRVNQHGRKLLGLQTEEIGSDQFAALFPRAEGGEKTADLPLQTAARTGEEVAESEGAIRPHGGSRNHTALLAAAPLGDPGGPHRGAIMTFVDVSDLKTAQHRQQLLLRALQHRVRNMLASIRSVATETLAASETLEDFAERFEGRLDALALTETLVSRRGGGSIDLRELLDEILLPEGTGDEVTALGPEVALETRAAQLLALTLNELKTNAIKHGALGSADGRIVVRWGVVSDGHESTVLRLRWQETGISAASDTTRGFGRELIEEGVPYELGGRGTWGITDGVLTCVVDLPMEPHVLSVGEYDPSAAHDIPEAP